MGEEIHKNDKNSSEEREESVKNEGERKNEERGGVRVVTEQTSLRHTTCNLQLDYKLSHDNDCASCDYNNRTHQPMMYLEEAHERTEGTPEGICGLRHCKLALEVHRGF